MNPFEVRDEAQPPPLCQSGLMKESVTEAETEGWGGEGGGAQGDVHSIIFLKKDTFCTHPLRISSNTAREGRRKEKRKDTIYSSAALTMRQHSASHLPPWINRMWHLKHKAVWQVTRLHRGSAHFCIMWVNPEVVWKGAWGDLNYWMFYQQWWWPLCQAPMAERGWGRMWNIWKTVWSAYPCEGCPLLDHPGPGKITYSYYLLTFLP